jgi:hypothetical protein
MTVHVVSRLMGGSPELEYTIESGMGIRKEQVNKDEKVREMMERIRYKVKRDWQFLCLEDGSIEMDAIAADWIRRRPA